MYEDKATTGELIDKADQLEESGDLNGAIHYWRLAVDREADPVALCRLGNVAMELGDLGEAEQAFLSAIDLAPRLPNAHNMLGLLYLERGDLEDARASFLRSAEIEQSARTLTFLGAVQLQLEMTDMARESLLKAVTLDPNYEEAHYNLGLTYRAEAPSEAVRSFRIAIKLDPQYALAHRELGWALRRLGQYPEAQRHIRRAIELDDSDEWVHIYLGNLLWITGDSSSAEQAFLRATQVWRDDSVPYWCLAMFYEYENRSEEARLFYEGALHLNPDDPEANRRFGLFLSDIGEPERAEPFLERARSLDQDT
jgi:tetratricopeptide (TPR) repeat protein